MDRFIRAIVLQSAVMDYRRMRAGDVCPMRCGLKLGQQRGEALNGGPESP